MNTRLSPGVGHLLTLGLLCLLTLGCGGRTRMRTPTPQPLFLLPTPRPNLLLNASFGEGTAAWQPSAGFASPTVTLAYDQAGYLTVAVGKAPVPEAAAWSQTVPVVPGAAYCASYRAHSESLAGHADMTLSFQDAAGGVLLETGVLPMAGDTGWASYGLRCRAPTGAAQAALSLGVDGATGGRVAFDESRFAPDDAPQVRALLVDWTQDVGILHSGESLGASTAPWDGGAYAAARLVAAFSTAQGAGADRPWGAPRLLDARGDLTAAGQARRMLDRLEETPRLLLAQGGDALGFTILAGRSDDGCRAQILIADTGSRSEGYRLGLAGFPPGYRYATDEVAEGQPLRTVAEGAGDDLRDGVLASPWRSPAVHLIRIEWP